MTRETILYIMIFILLGVFIWLVKYLEKKLPERDIRREKEWEEKNRLKNDRKKRQDKEDLTIRKVALEEEQKTKDIINKERKKKMYIDGVRKGRDYEIYIIDYFRKQGYQTKGHGLLNGKKDKGIDVIIMKNKDITLIQCKNWKANSSYKIKHKDLKEFLGNTTAFLDNNKEKAKGYNIKILFVTSNDVLDNSARHFLRDNKIVEHRVIPIEN